MITRTARVLFVACCTVRPHLNCHMHASKRRRVDTRNSVCNATRSAHAEHCLLAISLVAHAALKRRCSPVSSTPHVISLVAHAEHCAARRAYQTHCKETKHLFVLKKIHLGHAAKPFGLLHPPVRLSIPGWRTCLRRLESQWNE